MSTPHTEVDPISRPATWAVIAAYGAIVALVFFGQASHASVSQRVLVMLLVAVMASPLLIVPQVMRRTATTG